MLRLPDVQSGRGVVTRFAPEPSWVLDLGHCKALLMVAAAAASHQRGKWLLRFDDTNPNACCQGNVDAYLQDLPLLGLTPDRVSFASDHFQAMADTATKLIEAGFLYADDTPVAEMRAQRLAKQPSPRRDQPAAASLAAWAAMQAGSEPGRTYCLRFRLQPGSENGALRDPVAWRVIDTPHYRTGTRFKAYPTYDFAAPWLDLAEGVTHALRTLEFRDRDALFTAVQQAILRLGLHPEWRPSSIYEFPRIHMAFTPQAKAHQKALVAAGLVEGAADPRLPTLRGLMRAGCHPDALKAFLLEQVTPAKKETHHSWDKVWTLNRRLLDPAASRHMAVADEGRVLLTLLDGPETPEPCSVQWKQGHIVHVTRYKHLWLEQEDAQLLEAGNELTLLAWGNVTIVAVTREPDRHRPEQQQQQEQQPKQQQSLEAAATAAAAAAPAAAASSSRRVTAITAALHPSGDPKASIAKLHWLPALPDLLVRLRLVRFAHPVSVERVTDEVDVCAAFNVGSRQESKAWGDASLLLAARRGSLVQLQRKGFFIIDEVVLSASASAEAVAAAGSGAAAGGVVAPVGGERVVATGACAELRARDVERLVLFHVPDGHTKRGA